MNGGNHPRGGEPSSSQLLQGLQKGLEILLSLARGPVAPVTAGGGHHSLRKRREPPVVIPEIKPSALPPLVRRREDGRDVLLRPRLPQLEDAATGPHCHANSSFPRHRGKKLRGEEMGPQVPVGGNPQKSFANHREDGCLRDGVGTEIVQLHPVDVQNRPHETTCRHSEPPLVKETKLSTYPGGGDGAAPLGGAIHSGYESPERGRSKPSATRASRSSAVMVEKGHGSHGETTVTRSAITKQKRWRRRGQGVRFPFSVYSLRLRKPKWEASSRVKNRHRSLSRIYEGPGETRSTLRPNPPRDSKLKGETPVPRTARARTTAAPRTTRPVALTLRQDRRHLWQAKQATLHLRHNDRVKKGVPRRSISYPFPLPLSLSCYRDRERGYSERDPSPRRKWAPSPLLIRGSKVGPSEGFDSRLRALGPRAPLLIRGSKAGPSKGFDSRLRARRARDDSGYDRYTTKARATLPRYPRTFPRPAGAIL
jgi:hypothetical protein